MLAFFLAEWWAFFWPEVRGNVLAIVPCALAGWVWSKTHYWPLNLIHAKLDETLSRHRHAQLMLEEMHHLMHTGEEHPRVKARRAAGEHPTPRRDDA